MEEARAVCERVGGLLQELSRLQNEENRLLAKQAGLRPWESLDLPLETAGTEHVLLRLGVCPGATDVETVKTELAPVSAEFQEVSGDKQQKYCLLLCHRAEEEQAMEILRPHSFSVVSFQGVTGTARENLDRLEKQLAENRGGQEAAAAAIAESSQARDALRIYADRLAAEAAKDTSAERLLTDGTIVFFEGWVPAERIKEVQNLLEGLDCAWEAEDPAPPGPSPQKRQWCRR